MQRDAHGLVASGDDLVGQASGLIPED
jgi:hypothetical protein